MLRIIEPLFAGMMAALGILFGAMAIATWFKSAGKSPLERIQGAKLRALYLSLFSVAVLAAAAVWLWNAGTLLILPFIIAGIWLDYSIYKSFLNRSKRKR